MADIKITGYPELAATPDDADLLEIVDDVAGTPTSKKITVANLKAASPPNPSQPCFLVRPTSDQLNIAATGSYLDVIFGTEVFDIGNNFASNIFTASVTGKYILTVNLRLDNMDTAATLYGWKITTSNRIFEYIFAPKFTADPGWYHVIISIVTDMDVNDIAKIEIKQSGGTAQTDINTSSAFSGVLFC